MRESIGFFYLVLVFLVPSIFLTDLVTITTGVNFSAIARFLILLIVIVLYVLTTEHKRILRDIPLLLIVISLQLLVYIYDSHYWELLNNLNFVIKFISLYFWYNVSKNLVNYNTSSYVKVCDMTLLLYLCSILIAAIFEVSVMSTYGDTGRFGYKGVIPAANETAPLLLISSTWYALQFSKNINAINLFKLSVAFLACALIGTKAALIISVYSLFVVFFGLNNLLIRVVVITLLLIFISYLSYLNFDQILLAYQSTLSYFESKMVGTGLESWVFALLSGRNHKLESILDVYFSSEIYWYYLLVGSYSVGTYMSELDLVDTILLFGLPIGLIMYYLYFYAIYKISYNQDIGLSFCILLFFLSILAGHVVFSAVYLPFMMAMFFKNYRYGYGQ